ncbi:hypothetical protein [Shewanella litorisediminis]|uniref:Uncharacterized protein n=1 Tax=Shewanella litorisediminis TaxID=1173586 RepID=A0ABX7G3S5_9GAMM|nr:hypothetical protein [Shewanella litorisediminis]MCL2919450.1 hypothetical protein [Shewanella litorisediminis]QRH01939.1 hypothetical protein JQC75_00375 [Shewanella litorisediminis]
MAIIGIVWSFFVFFMPMYLDSKPKETILKIADISGGYVDGLSFRIFNGGKSKTFIKSAEIVRPFYGGEGWYHIHTSAADVSLPVGETLVVKTDFIDKRIRPANVRNRFQPDEYDTCSIVVTYINSLGELAKTQEGYLCERLDDFVRFEEFEVKMNEKSVN